MQSQKKVHMLYAKDGCELLLDKNCEVLEGQNPPAIANIEQALLDAFDNPIGAKALPQLLAERKPTSCAITISDITRPVPNKIFLPPLLALLNKYGLNTSNITIIVGTGMHRPSTPDELAELVGEDILNNYTVIDHTAEKSETLVRVTEDDGENPPVSVCKIFAEADFKIVTGYIEPHFMAGFSGGRKGVCPALVDLATLQRFHGYKTLSDPAADNGQLENNPCHSESLRVAKAVGVDFLLNVAINRQREIAGIYCGDLEAAHAAGCEQVATWTTATIDEPFDLVITNGGGYPLDQNFYQSVKGQCTALAAVKSGGVIMQLTSCAEGLGSPAYTDCILKTGKNWQKFLTDIAASGETMLDQWQMQMQCRVLEKIAIDGLRIFTDGIEAELLGKIAITPIGGPEPAPLRLQQAVDAFLEANPSARCAIIPEGPYTMIKLRN